jgi:hypothetical protein
MVESNKVVLIDDNTGRKLPAEGSQKVLCKLWNVKKEYLFSKKPNNTCINHLPKLL